MIIGDMQLTIAGARRDVTDDDTSTRAAPTGMTRRAPLPHRGGSGGGSSNVSEENDDGNDEIDSNNWLQSRPWSGPGETPDRTSETAGVYLRDLPRHEQSDGIARARRQIAECAHHRDRPVAKLKVKLYRRYLTDTANYTKVVNAVAERVKGTGLNVLFNNAGISSKFTRLGLVKQEQITDALLINTVAPILLTKDLDKLIQGFPAAAESSRKKRRGQNGTEREESGRRQYDLYPGQYSSEQRRRVLSLQMQQDGAQRGDQVDERRSETGRDSGGVPAPRMGANRFGR
ncbi:uncharacterized protein LOC109853792 isoform X3 [Pseudomyrmex gracilis]|uniref:uncharacterized protein LOC109853792 isoform X3 n=1 Tax=Pseudomyrmex gracilis TaxID=219809 RepID=UPI00099550F9|nr:uncharacterized protein LOC109853792 isoform X3 [Pseudomyrmex gracilis]